MVAANKSILGMRSQYFRSMFSSNNNFVESQAGSVKLPYIRAVVDKVVLYLYGGQLDCEDLALEPMLNLLEIFNLMNLPRDYNTLTEFTEKQISSIFKILTSSGWRLLETAYWLTLERISTNFPSWPRLEVYPRP